MANFLLFQQPGNLLIKRKASRWPFPATLACSLFVGTFFITPSIAQTPVCINLRAQLERWDGAGTPANPEQYERVSQQVNNQQYEIDRASARYYQLKCNQTGFLFFKSRRNKQCQPLEVKLKQMQTNLQRLRGQLTQLTGRRSPSVSSAERDQLVEALRQRRCDGAELYVNSNRSRSIRRNESRGILGDIFSGRRNRSDDVFERTIEPGMAPIQGTYRTMCVRMCDGYYFPISFSTIPDQFSEDAEKCFAQCPGAEADLYIHFNPGEIADQMRHYDTEEAYQDLPNAFIYRRRLKPNCQCRSAEQLPYGVTRGGILETSRTLNDDGTETKASDLITEREDEIDLDTHDGSDKIVLLPQAKPALGEDPDTQLNLLSGFDPLKALIVESRTIASTDGKRIRIVGPKFFSSQ